MISLSLLCLFMAPQEGAEELVRRLSEDSIEVRAAAEEKLLKLGEAARDALVKASEKAEPSLKFQITRILKALDLRIQLKGWLAPPSRITLSGEMSLEEAAREIENQSGQKVACDAWPEGKFRVDLKNALYWNALESICEASKSRSLFARATGPVIGGTKYVKVPASVSGPFCLRFESIREDRRFSNGHESRTLTFLFHLGWERSIAPAKVCLAMEEARDDAGTNYIPGFEEYQSRVFSGTPYFVQDPPASFMKPLHVGSFARLAEKAERMVSLKGSALIWIRASTDDLELPITGDPADTHETELSVCGEDLKERSRGTFTLSNANRKGDTVTFSLKVAGLDARMMKDTSGLWHVKDGKGQRYVASPNSWQNPTPAGLGYGFMVRGVPPDAVLKAFVIRIPRRVVALEVPFQIQDISLK